MKTIIHKIIRLRDKYTTQFQDLQVAHLRDPQSIPFKTVDNVQAKLHDIDLALAGDIEALHRVIVVLKKDEEVYHV